VTPARCPSCGAAVPDGAPWCSLCFADLRPAQPVVASHRPVATVATPAPPVPQSVAEPAVIRPNRPGRVPLDDPIAPPAQEPTWPCQACGDRSPISSDTCVHCGSAFLAGADALPSAVLPVVGDLQAMSRGSRLVLALVAALGTTVLFVLLAFVFGKVL
jgi:hypothetical protein